MTYTGPTIFNASQLGLAGIQALINAYKDADDDDEVIMRAGSNEAGQTFAVISICETTVALTQRECRGLANSCEKALMRFPETPEARGLPNLINGLRAVADDLDKYAL